MSGQRLDLVERVEALIPLVIPYRKGRFGSNEIGGLVRLWHGLTTNEGVCWSFQSFPGPSILQVDRYHRASHPFSSHSFKS